MLNFHWFDFFFLKTLFPSRWQNKDADGLFNINKDYLPTYQLHAKDCAGPFAYVVPRHHNKGGFKTPLPI